MKKIAAFSALLLVILLVLPSCEKETMLTVDQTSISFTDAGGSQTVTLTANKPWSVSSTQSWCKVSPSGGEEAAGSRISISCDANTTYDARTCTVTFTCAEMTKSVTISQATNNGLQVSKTTYEVTRAAQQLNIEVKANVKFSVEVDNGCKDWVKYNTTKALTTSTVVLDIAENTSYDGREGKVTIKQDGGSLSSTITIKQSQLDGLFLTTSEYNLSNEKHTLTVEVKSNIDFEVKSEADWIKYVETKGLKTNQIILDVAANETYDAREGKVIVKQKNGDLTGTITVKQEQNYGLILSQTAFDLGNDAQTIEVEVKYNVDFDVVIPSGCKDWIKQVSTKGLNSRTYTFSIGKNETYDAREGSITFKQKNGSLSGTVSVKQSQNNGLFVTKSDYEINNESQTVNVEVKANIDFEVKSEANWITVVETKGLKTSTFTLSVEENDSFDIREGKVSVKQIDGNLSGDITIKQKGKNGIILPQTEYELTNEAQTLNVEVQTTVLFEVMISDSGKDWVSLVSTKALDNKTCSFSIKKNNTYDNRECTVTFKQKEGNLSNSLVIRQKKTEVLSINKDAFDIDVSGGTISFEVLSNIDYSVSIREEDLGWISQINTKGASTTTFYFSIASCDDNVDRTGIISVVGNSLKIDIYVHQFALTSNEPIVFKDAAAKYACLEKFDINKDGEVSFREAANAKDMSGLFTNWNTVSSFDELEYFTGITSINQLFMNCASLVSTKIPSNVKELGDYTFYGCLALEEVILPEGIRQLGYNCFDNCQSLKKVSLPQSLERICPNAFNRCSSLTTIKIPQSVSYIGDYVFEGCTSLTEVLLPDKMERIGSCIFRNCSSLVTVRLPETISDIPMGTFENCTSLKSLTLPKNYSSIGDKAFWGVSLWSIRIPKSVTRIGHNCFNDIRNIILESEDFITITEQSFAATNMAIFVPSQLIEQYKVRTTWSSFKNQLFAITQYKEQREYAIPKQKDVELGLSVKWASYDIGASSVGEYGKHFAWAETEPKTEFNWSTYKYEYMTSREKYYYGDGKSRIEEIDDAAHVSWGGKWRIPTEEEWRELMQSCLFVEASYSGQKGYQVLSPSTGTSIFLPLGGYYDAVGLHSQGICGYYWSANTNFVMQGASAFTIWELGINISNFTKFMGLTIRPVLEY